MTTACPNTIKINIESMKKRDEMKASAEWHGFVNTRVLDLVAELAPLLHSNNITDLDDEEEGGDRITVATAAVCLGLKGFFPNLDDRTAATLAYMAAVIYDKGHQDGYDDARLCRGPMPSLLN